MPSRNVLFMVAMPCARDLSYLQYCLHTWERWCHRHQVRLFLWREPLADVALMKPTWQRYHLFEILEREGIPYDRVAYLDCDTMVRWDCPNFFEGAGDELGVVRDQTPRWIYQSMKAYRPLFPAVDLRWYDYFNAGFMLLNRGHRDFYRQVNEFYQRHRDELLALEDGGGIGTDQTPVNYLAVKEAVPLRFLPRTFNLQPLPTLLRDFMFVEMGYIWHFAGIPPEPRLAAMRATWEAFSSRYLRQPLGHGGAALAAGQRELVG
jgi:lipopolysaccharide biosynthesis glycosyltransferase